MQQARSWCLHKSHRKTSLSSSQAKASFERTVGRRMFQPDSPDAILESSLRQLQSRASVARFPEGTAGLHSAGPDYELQLAGCPRLLLISEAQLPGSRGREIPSAQRRRVPPSAPARPAAAAGTPRSSSANICCRPARAPSAAPGAPPGGSPPSLPPRRLLIYLLSRPRLAPRPEPRRGCEGRRRGGFAPARR